MSWHILHINNLCVPVSSDEYIYIFYGNNPQHDPNPKFRPPSHRALSPNACLGFHQQTPYLIWLAASLWILGCQDDGLCVPCGVLRGYRATRSLQQGWAISGPRGQVVMTMRTGVGAGGADLAGSVSPDSRPPSGCCSRARVASSSRWVPWSVLWEPPPLLWRRTSNGSLPSPRNKQRLSWTTHYCYIYICNEV